MREIIVMAILIGSGLTLVTMPDECERMIREVGLPKEWMYTQ